MQPHRDAMSPTLFCVERRVARTCVIEDPRRGGASGTGAPTFASPHETVPQVLDEELVLCLSALFGCLEPGLAIFARWRGV